MRAPGIPESRCTGTEDATGMGTRIVDWTKSREQRKGLRPRDAAMLIAFAWFATILVFGFLERLLDPKTFQTIGSAIGGRCRRS